MEPVAAAGHLDTCQYQTWLVAKVPWAEDNRRLTALFEALVIDLLKVAPVAEVPRQLKLSWAAVYGVQRRAVARGLAPRKD